MAKHMKTLAPEQTSDAPPVAVIEPPRAPAIDRHPGIPVDSLCEDESEGCVACGGTGEKIRQCPRCGRTAMRARLDHGGLSGLPVIGRKCDACGLVEPPTYLRRM